MCEGSLKATPPRNQLVGNTFNQNALGPSDPLFSATMDLQLDGPLLLDGSIEDGNTLQGVTGGTMLEIAEDLMSVQSHGSLISNSTNNIGNTLANNIIYPNTLPVSEVRLRRRVRDLLNASEPLENTPREAITSDASTILVGPGSPLDVLHYSLDLPSRKCFPQQSTKQKQSDLQDVLAAITNIRESVENLIVRAPTVELEQCSPEPSAMEALEFIDTFFTSCQVTWPIIRRQSFMTMWHSKGGLDSDIDVSWSMLRNAVLALGAFTYISGFGASKYQAALIRSMLYFNKLLVLECQSYRFCSSLQVVQALLLMSMFANAVGFPKMVHKYASQAVYVAKGLGLHRGASQQRHERAQLNTADDHDRVFWIVYIFDKLLSTMNGRMSDIDDGAIGCPFPENLAKDFDGAHGDGATESLKCCVRYADLIDDIQTSLYDDVSMRDSNIQQLSTERNRLLQHLEQWRDQVPDKYQIKNPMFRSRTLAPGETPVRALLFRICYEYARANIARRFSTWRPEDAKTTLPAGSDKTYLEACRELVLLLDRVELGVDIPYIFVLNLLVAAIIPLFLAMGTAPATISAESDMALMHVAAGIVGKLKYLTSGEIELDPISQLPRLATRVVQRFQTSTTHSIALPQTAHVTSGMKAIEDTRIQQQEMPHALFMEYGSLEPQAFADLDMDNLMNLDEFASNRLHSGS